MGKVLINKIRKVVVVVVVVVRRVLACIEEFKVKKKQKAYKYIYLWCLEWVFVFTTGSYTRDRKANCLVKCNFKWEMIFIE